MKLSTTTSTCMALALVLSVSPVAAEGHKESDGARARMKMGTAGDVPSQIIDRSVAAHKALQNVPASIKDKAQCIVIVPGLTTAALGVGGSHGDGVAVCKTDVNTWSSPAFVDLDSASIGLQAGAKTSDMIVYLTSKKAADSLKAGSIMLGADASVVAGNFERTFDTSGKDAIAYQNNSGAFVGASVGVGKITSDDDSNRALYGKNYQAGDILNGKVSIENDSAKMLNEQLKIN